MFTYESPIGPIHLVASGDSLCGLYLAGDEVPEGDDSPVLREAAGQLDEYFEGRRREFDLPLRLAGTPFQRQVWDALRQVPFGESRSYSQIARALGRPKACRAVGAANGRNPISIVVPCHRVIGADGSLVGYGGGEAAKRWLLEHERRVAPART